MALLNPVHGLVVPFLCLFTIPLAIFAGITTTLAFTVLMFRVAVVYLDIALAMIPQYFKGRSKPRMDSVAPATPLPLGRRASRAASIVSVSGVSPTGSVSSGRGYSPPSPIVPFPPVSGGSGTPYGSFSEYRSPAVRRRSSYGFGAVARHSSRRSSQVSLASHGTITPIHEGCVIPAVGDQPAMTPSCGIDRDYEGIGGWRLDDHDDDADWTNINSRLELPSERQSFSTRHHQRSQSAGPTTPGDATWLMMKTTSKLGSVSGEKGDLPLRIQTQTSAASASPNSGRFRSSQSLLAVNSAIAQQMDQDNGYFPAQVSPRTLKKPSFST